MLHARPHQHGLRLFLGLLSSDLSGPGLGQVRSHLNHACSVHRGLWSPLCHSHSPTWAGAPRPAAWLPKSRWQHGTLDICYIKSYCMARTETSGTPRDGKELKLRVRPQAGGRTAAWARRSHSLLSGHEYGSARIAALRRRSADLPESYDIISIYKCRNKGIQ